LHLLDGYLRNYQGENAAPFHPDSFFIYQPEG
jgi:hypothetical protein